ncbi:MAG: DUF1080 domain-containing protein [Candidatus Solibacter usitatus]|nr:DUF1080 domain-containing protein [Candidatus Solibacter usitatus]
MAHRAWAAAVVLSLMAGSAAGQDGKAKTYRTSPIGYDDTPVLPGQKWRVHDISRPRPRVVTPGEQPGRPPSDAIVLFDGKDLSKWVAGGRRQASAPPPGWKVENGYVEAVHGTGDLVSKERFGNCQIHVEWAAPTEIDGSSQWRGNSGVLLMNRYEIQVLDSYENPTYADGQAAAIYGQYPPLVNASRKPGEWQTYDIVFEAPRFEGEKLVKPAFVTVFHNGVLTHHRQEITGRMAHKVVGTYAPHAPEEPLGLQNHDTPVRYRNIWVRRLGGYDQP